MNVLILSIPIVFLLGIIVGFFIGRKKEVPILTKPKDVVKLKVIHKAQPKTYKQRQSEAVDKGKPIIKIFRK